MVGDPVHLPRRLARASRSGSLYTSPVVALPLAFGEARFAACLRAAPGLARLAAFFRVAFFFAAMSRLVPLIRFHILPESVGETIAARPGQA